MKDCRTAFIMGLLTCVFAGLSAAQSKPNARRSQADPSLRTSQTYPSPTNLKVLPNSLTGLQVHNIMQQWSAELGVRCSACHVRDLDGVTSDGSPHHRFADDSKPMKGIARLMYAMTAEINRKYITWQDRDHRPVDCGTCHRGSLRPEPFVAQRNEQGPANHNSSQDPRPPDSRESTPEPNRGEPAAGKRD